MQKTVSDGTDIKWYGQTEHDCFVVKTPENKEIYEVYTHFRPASGKACQRIFNAGRTKTYIAAGIRYGGKGNSRCGADCRGYL